MIPRPPTSTRLPYTTPFRSLRHRSEATSVVQHRQRDDERAAKQDPQELLKVEDRKSTRLNSSHANISYAVFCLKNKPLQQVMHNSCAVTYVSENPDLADVLC